MKIELTKEELDKLYQDSPMHPETETEFQRVYRMGRNALVLELIEKLTPIELPSDEKIHKEKYSYYRDVDCVDTGLRFAFVQGAKWMRDKIEGGNK
jgi:hypothetical protein